MNIQKDTENINVAFALKIRPSSSLIEILRRLNMEELSSIAAEWRIRGRSRMTKEKIITKLLIHTLDRKRIENVLLVTEPDEYDLFLKLLDKEHIQDNSFLYGIYGHLMEEGIIYSFYDEGRFFLAVPEEIKEAYRIFGNIHFDETLKRHQLVYKYISALNNLYGVFKMEKLIEIFNCQNDKQLTSKEFLAILDKHLLRQQSFYYYDGYIINDYFDDEELPEAELLLENTADMPYYIPGRNDISKYADDSYFEMTPQLTALKHYIIKNMCSNDELVGYLIDDIELICSMEEPMQDVIYEFERRSIFFKDMKQLKSIIPLIEDVYNNVRTWLNKGHTYAEIHKITGRLITKRFHQPIEVLINNKTVPEDRQK